MAIEVIKPIWVDLIDAYVVKIGGKSYVIDLDVKPAKSKPAKAEKSESRKLEKSLSEELILIQSGASYEEVIEKFPDYKKPSYYQARKRLGLSKKTKKKAKGTELVEKSTTRAKKSSSKAVASDSKPESHSTEHTSTPVE